MTRVNRRLLLTLGLIVCGAIGVAVVLMRSQPEPPRERTPRQEQTPPQKQEPEQEQEPRQEPQQQQQQQQPHQPRTSPEPEQQAEPRQEEEPQQEQEPHARVVSTVRALSARLEDYKSRTGAYPTNEQGLRVLGAAPKDPWQDDYVYHSPSTRGRESYDLFSAGPDGRPDTPDDDWGEEGAEDSPADQ